MASILEISPATFIVGFVVCAFIGGVMEWASERQEKLNKQGQ